ncbi:MAG TPA: Gfo/Idh/MocA family oxidoreductase [Pirellulales bacterium]|nr:Gfo/Idh/MocA family oxidoreductase [Pirellulales bacterium]
MNESSAPPLSTLRVAVVGLGSIGCRHLKNLERLGVERLTVVRRVTGANPAFQPPPGATVVHSMADALARGLDAAIICNPTSVHVSTAIECMAAGVAVLVEKPISHRLDEADQLLQAAQRSGTRAGMAYVMRYHPAYRMARDMVVSGQLGRVLYAKAWFEAYLPDWHPWEDYRQGYAARRELGGGALPTLDHEIDFLNGCFGEPQFASGWTGRSGALETDADDWATIFVRYAGGVSASCAFSLCRRDRSRGFEIVGEQATLSFRFETGKLELLNGGDRQTLWDGAEYDLNDAYLAMLRHFLEALIDHRATPIGLEAGLQALRVAASARPAATSP